MDLTGKKIAILATNGFERAELEVSQDRLKKAGATVDVVSLAAGEIKGWDKKDWGRPVKVDKALEEASAPDYDAIVLPGGQINPDLLRVEPKALFIKDIFDAKKVVAGIFSKERFDRRSSWSSRTRQLISGGGRSQI